MAVSSVIVLLPADSLVLAHTVCTQVQEDLKAHFDLREKELLLDLEYREHLYKHQLALKDDDLESKIEEKNKQIQDLEAEIHAQLDRQ